MQRRQRGGIGVAEAYRRRARFSPGVKGGVTGHIGVAGLDQIRPQVAQGPGPFAEVGRTAIAVAEREEGGGQAHHAPGHAVGGGPWRHQGMLQPGAFTHPLMLGEQVALHAAAARREKHGCVDQMQWPVGREVGTGGKARGNGVGPTGPCPKPVGQAFLPGLPFSAPR